MTQDEKNKLLDLLGNEGKWCRETDARDEQGDPVHYDDEKAAAWDVVGGMCRLFGWSRACELFGQVARHFTGSQPPRTLQDPEMGAMAVLQDFNDDQNTTYTSVMAQLQGLPVSQGRPSSAAFPSA